MKIKKRMVSLVVATLAGCCFFGTCVEAKAKDINNNNDYGLIISFPDREKEELNENLGMLKFVKELGTQEGKPVSLRNYSRYNECKKRFKKDSYKKFLKKYGIKQINIKYKDKKVLKAFENYVDEKFGGSVDSCFIGGSLEGFLTPMKLNITWEKWREAVTKVVKELKAEGKRPFIEGIGNIKEMLAEGRPISSAMDFIDDIGATSVEQSAYSKEFIKRLAKELGVKFDTLYKHMGFGFILGVDYKEEI